jgi:hypothetical protein
MTATAQNCQIVTTYKGYTIQKDNSFEFAPSPLILYPTEQGIQHDYDMDQDGNRYTGNCKWADSISEAKVMIDELVPFLVETYTRKDSGLNITKFDWLSDAVKFAGKFNGSMNVCFNSI